MKNMKSVFQKLTIQEADVLLDLQARPFENQRILAENVGLSLGAVNRCLKNLKETGMLDESHRLTTRAIERIEESSPGNAIILAAGA